MNSSDAELIRASLDDPEAFVELFDRHFDPIYGYLSRRIGPDTGSELASEVFTAAFAQRARYDLSRADAAPWLYGIAANLLRRRHRSESRRLRAYARTPVERAPEMAAGLPADPGIAAALAALRPVDREVLLLFAWADLDYEQIAEALRVPVGTVRSRLHRARQQLRAALAHIEVFEPEEAFNG
jgi:RNA polymerase sigma-70 factor (ECF subfamily)